jgi:hypothetical protein
MDPMFEITRGEENVQEGPRIAEEFVRGQGHPRLEDAGRARGTINKSEGYLRFRDDAVLLITGTTRDLLAACNQARDAGIHMIGTENDHVLRLLFTRVKVSSANQTDTLIAIGSTQGLLSNQPNYAHGDKGWKVIGVTPDYTSYVKTYADTDDNPSRPLALPTMISDIKERSPSATVETLGI